MPLVRQALTAGVGQILVQAEKFRKKFRIPPNQQLRVPFKHTASRSSSHFVGLFRVWLGYTNQSQPRSCIDFMGCRQNDRLNIQKLKGLSSSAQVLLPTAR